MFYGYLCIATALMRYLPDEPVQPSVFLSTGSRHLKRRPTLAEQEERERRGTIPSSPPPPPLPLSIPITPPAATYCSRSVCRHSPPLAAPVIAAPKLLRCHVLLGCHTGHRLAHNQMSTTAKYWPSFAAAPFHSINTSFRMTFNIVKLLNSHFWGAKNCIFLNQVLSHQVCKCPVFTPSLRKCCVLSCCSHTRIEWDKRRVTQ